MWKLALCGPIAIVIAGCGGKTKIPDAAIVGWHAEEGWADSCYYPPNFDEMGVLDRRMARQKALEQMMSQWKGDHDQVVRFDAEAIDRFELVLLGDPERIESVSVENLGHCKAAMSDRTTIGTWTRWFVDTPARLTEGECRYAPLDYTLFDYLDIGKAWQIPANVCEGDRVQVSGSSTDFYRIEEDGPWINVAGDPERPALGAELPCNFEGCYHGQLVLRFVGDSGSEVIHPVGLGVEFEAPEHGRIEIQINDTTWFDNVYKVESGIEHHTSIEYDGDHS